MKPSRINILICLSICAALVVTGIVWTNIYSSRQRHHIDFSEEGMGNRILSLHAESEQRRNPSFKSADSADDIVGRSDCVIRVRVDPGYDIIHQYFLSAAEVLETLYGEPPESDTIYIYESVLCLAHIEYEKFPMDFFRLYGVQNKLDPGREYVVCLKKLDFAKGSFSSVHDGKVYMYTDEMCSAFPCEHEPEYLILNNRDYDFTTDPIFYRDVKDIDYIGNKALINGAIYLYNSMVDKFGEEAFGLVPKEHEGPEALIPTLPPAHMPEKGTVEWLAAELERRCFEGQIHIDSLPDYSDIMDDNDDTALFRTASTFEFMRASFYWDERHILGISVISSKIMRVESETTEEITVEVCVKTVVGYEKYTKEVESVFTITVDKQRMVVTAYDRPADDGSIYSEYLKPLALSYSVNNSWDDACYMAMEDLIGRLDENGELH